MKTRYKHVYIEPDRHGKLRTRFRKGKRQVYMNHLPDEDGFEDEYKALLGGGESAKTETYPPGSVHDLCIRYYQSGDFNSGGAEDRGRRRGIIESFREEFGNDLVRNFGFEHIEAILLARTEKKKNDKGRTVGGQVAARNLRKQLRRLFAYARKLKWITGNPVEEAAKIGKAKVAGFYPWTEADIARYKNRHPLGTKARLALEIILWTGQRRGDARLFGPKHVVRGKINFKASKNDADLWLPMAPDLRAAIAAMPSVGITTFLVTDYGHPFSKDGFGNKMREWCDQAGLPQCTAHGLRKAMARRMASARATQQQIKAAGGWKGDEEVATYVAGIEQEDLAEEGLNRAIERYRDDPGS